MSASPRRSIVTDCPALVVQFAAAVKTDPRSLALLSEGLVSELCAESKLSLAERVVIESYIARVRNEKLTVGDVAERQELQKLYPWREAEARSSRLMDRFTAEFASASADGKDPFAPLRAAFEANAKAGLISTDVSLVLSYTLFTQNNPDLGRFLLASLLLSVQPDQRLPTHNWHMAGHMDQAVKYSVGACIDKLTAPLWPPHCTGADTLNAKLLRSAQDFGQVAGGGTNFSTEFSITGGPLGGGWLAVNQQQDGAYGVDTMALEHAIAQEYNPQIARLKEEIKNLHRRRQEPQLPPQYQQQPQQQQQQYSPQRQQQQQQRGLPQQISPQQQPSFTQPHTSIATPPPKYTRRQKPPQGGDPAGTLTFDELFGPTPGPTAPPSSAPATVVKARF